MREETSRVGQVQGAGTLTVLIVDPGSAFRSKRIALIQRPSLPSVSTTSTNSGKRTFGDNKRNVSPYVIAGTFIRIGLHMFNKQNSDAENEHEAMTKRVSRMKSSRFLFTYRGSKGQGRPQGGEEQLPPPEFAKN